MDPEAFLEMANQVTKLKMFPYFDVAHCALCCLYVREDLGTGEDANSFVCCMWFIGSPGLPVDSGRRNWITLYKLYFLVIIRLGLNISLFLLFAYYIYSLWVRMESSLFFIHLCAVY